MRVDDVYPPRRDVVAQNQFALVLVGELLIVCIRRLEPRSRQKDIQVNRIVLIRLPVETVKQRLVIAHIVQGENSGESR